MSQQTELRIPQFVVKIGGSTVSHDFSYDIARIDVDRAIFLPGMATIELHDEKLKWADHSMLAIGKALAIHAGAFDDVSSRPPIFEGEITSIELNMFSVDSSSLFIRAYDKSHRLQRMTRAKSFNQQTDSDAMRAAISGAGAGLAPELTATSEVHEQILQDNISDFDFICRLARRNGLVVLPEGPKLIVKKPTDFTAEPIPLDYRNTLIEFHPVLSAASQVAKVTTRGWDPKQKQASVGLASSSNSGAVDTGWGKSGSDISRSSFGDSAVLISDVPFSKQSSGDALAAARLSDRWRRDVHGEGTAVGEPNVQPGSWLKLTKVGTRFSGKYFVTRTRHVYTADYYRTHFWISGLEPETTADLILGSNHAGGASSSPPPGTGVAIGIVTNVNDPDKMGRVKLKFPWLDDNLESTWARVASPMAGAKRGIQFMPEVNDEVVVAFDHGDRSHPFVLGSLWNGVDSPPMEYSKFFSGGKVVRRQIVSPRGHVLEFDDTENAEKVSLTTQGKNTIVVDDKAKTITVADSHLKNTFVIDSNGTGKVTIQSSGDVTVEATGKVTVNAKMDALVNGMNVKVEAKGNLELSGLMVKVAAKTVLDLTGNAMTIVKGGIVKIN